MAIVSFSHKFIFIKTTKTAGTSMEIHLASGCSSIDIVTPFGRAEKGHQPRNYVVGKNSSYFNHMPATRVRELEPVAFSNFYKFCFERHPIDKSLSHFAMLLNSPMSKNPGSPKTWEEYIDQSHFPLDHNKYLDHNENLIVDKIYRYEEMDLALRDIFEKTGIGEGPLLPRAKGNFRHGAPRIEDVEQSKYQKDKIFEAFSKSLKYIDYY